MSEERIPLFELSFPELEEFVTQTLGERRFRASQIYGWLYRSLVADFSAMHNLPQALRAKLSQVAKLGTLTPLSCLASRDGPTQKVLFQLEDGQAIESVLMLYRRRRTACISSQIGCPIGCPFCATGQSGFVRNLRTGEILEQALYFARELKAASESLTNVVFMGLGEALANYDATWKAIERLHDPTGFDLGARRLTISTAGLVPGIERLSREGIPVRLAVSLHAADDSLRDQLVPLNKKYPLQELMRACREYSRAVGRRITFEYVLIRKVNDEAAQAQKLAELLQDIPCQVNLIPLNPIPEFPHRPSPRRAVLAFQSDLARQGIPATVRLGRGLDIQAGCGQLRAQPGLSSPSPSGHNP